jgi:hypothetical protein
VVEESFFGRSMQERVFWRNYHTRFEAQQDELKDISMLLKANGIDIWAT